MIDISLLDPAAIAFVLGFIVPLFVYTTRGARPNSTNNRLARSNVTGFVDSLFSDDGTNATLTSGQLIVPNGSVALPSLAFAGDPTTGFSWSGTGLRVNLEGVNEGIWFPGGDFRIASNTGRISFGTSSDALIGWEAAAIIQQGDDSATPIAQIHKGPDGSGTDIAGGHMTVAPGRGTGTGVGGQFRIATAPAGSTGSTQNALVDRLIIDSTGFTSLTALTVASLTGAAGYRGIAMMNSGTTVVSVAATAAQSGAVILTQILQYVGDVNSQAGFSTAVQSVRAGAFEIVAVGSRAPVDSAPIAWFVLR